MSRVASIIMYRHVFNSALQLIYRVISNKIIKVPIRVSMQFMVPVVMSKSENGMLGPTPARCVYFPVLCSPV